MKLTGDMRVIANAAPACEWKHSRLVKHEAHRAVLTCACGCDELVAMLTFDKWTPEMLHGQEVYIASHAPMWHFAAKWLTGQRYERGT